MSDANNLVEPGLACPRCGENDADMLVWNDDELVECQSCRMVYDPGANPHDN